MRSCVGKGQEMIADRGGFVEEGVLRQSGGDEVMPIEAFIRRISYYCHIDTQMADDIRRAAGTLRHYDAGQSVIEIGQKLDSAFIVSAGWAIRYKTLEDGRRQILNVLLPGDIFDLQVLAASEADHGVATITEFSIYQLGKEELTGLITGTRKLSVALWWTMVQEEAFLREQIIRNGRQSARERIGHFLLELNRRINITQDVPENGFRLPLTQTHIADALGLTPIHTNRVLRQLQREELIERERGYVRFLQPDRLAEICHFEPDYFHIDSFDRQLGGSIFTGADE